MTRDGRVLVWTERGLGARVAASGVPSGQPKLLALTDESVLLVKQQGLSVRLTRLNRTEGAVETNERLLTTALGEVLFPGEGDAIVLVYPHQADAVDARTGATLASCPMPGPSRRGYVVGRPWRRLVWNGVALSLEPVEVEGAAPRDVLWVFDWAPSEGPLALVRGAGVLAATGEVILEGDVAGFSGISPDGNRIASRAADGSYLLFDLSRKNVVRAAEYDLTWIETTERHVPTRNLRTRIVSVSASRTGGLVIGTAKGDFLELVAKNDGALALALTRCAREGDLRALKPHPVNARYGCELSVATFGDGTRIFLDSRGPLHLKPSKPDVEEVSVVLTEGAAAAWSSRGDVHGPRFFLGRAGSASASEMIAKIRRILEPVA